jgi:hypothetical protein
LQPRDTEALATLPPERTVAFEESAGMAKTIRVVTVRAHRTVRARLANARNAPVDFPVTLIDRPCI